MKVHMYGLPVMLSGRDNDVVYCYNKKTRKSTVRKHVIPKHTEHNDKMTAISLNLKSLNISEDYKQDLKQYCHRYNYSSRRTNCCNIYNYSMFIKLMWAMSKQMDIDLATITREQIESDNLPCRTVKQAVEAGLIPPVQCYKMFTNQM